MIRYGLLVAVVVLLVGCAQVEHAPQDDFSEAQLEQLHEQVGDVNWANLGYRDELRPQIDSFVVVSAADWWPLFQTCMDEAGYPGYPNQTFNDGELDMAESQALSIADFSCQQQTLTDPVSSGYLSPAQADYAYDYYQQTLIPCLALRQVAVTDIPSRADFVESFGAWSPYWSISLNFEDRHTREMLEACPAIAPGLPDLGFYG